MKKNPYLLLLIIVFSFASLFSPSIVKGSTDSTTSVESVVANIDGQEVVVEVEEQTDSNVTFTTKVEGTINKVQVNYVTGDITVENSERIKETYNLEDFISDEQPAEITLTQEEENKLLLESGVINEEFTSEELVAPSIDVFEPHETVSYDSSLSETTVEPPLSTAVEPTYSTSSSRGFITNLNTRLAVSGTINWKHVATYNKPVKVYAYQANHSEYTKAAKKFQFGVGTTVSTILGVIAAFVGAGFGLTALMGIMQGLGITIVSDAIQYLWSPTISVKRVSKLRAFYCGGGFTTVTKNWTNYVEGASNGKLTVKSYSSGKYNTWYNNLETWKNADVAYQMYRYIKYQRSTTPYPSEFYWY